MCAASAMEKPVSPYSAAISHKMGKAGYSFAKMVQMVGGQQQGRFER